MQVMLPTGCSSDEVVVISGPADNPVGVSSTLDRPLELPVLKVAQNHVLRGAADWCSAQSLSSPLTAGHCAAMCDANRRRHPAKGLSVLCSSLSA